MSDGDNEEVIRHRNEAEKLYRRLYPWRAPPVSASERVRAYYLAEVQAWMNTGYGDNWA